MTTPLQPNAPKFNYPSHLLSLQMVQNALNAKVKTLETSAKENVGSGWATTFFGLFRTEKQIALGRMKGLQKEIETLNEKFAALHTKSNHISKDLDQLINKLPYGVEDHVNEIGLRQHLLACEELTAEILRKIAEKELEIADLLDANGLKDVAELKKRITILDANLNDKTNALIDEASSFNGIRDIFQKIQNERFKAENPGQVGPFAGPAVLVSPDGDTFGETEVPDYRKVINPLDEIPKNVLAARAQLIKDFDLPKDLQALEEKLGREESINVNFTRIKKELEVIESAIKMGRLPEISYQLTEKEILDLKILKIDKQIELAEMKIYFNKKEAGESTEALQQRIESLKADKVARQNMNEMLINKESATRNFMGKILNKALDTASRVTSAFMTAQATRFYQWENKEWGKILLGTHLESSDEERQLNNKFKASINSLKNSARKLDLVIKTMEEERRELSRRIDDIELRGGIPLRELEENDQKLMEALANARADRQNLKISIRAAFLQKIIEGVGERQKMRRKLDQKIVGIKGEIAEREKFIKERQGRAEVLSQSDQRLLNDYISQQQEDEEKLKTMENKYRDLGKEVDILKAGYFEQIRKYKSLDRPSTSLIDQLANMAVEKLQAFVTLGYVNNAYKEPRDFELDFQFAEHGYHWLDELPQFLNMQGESIPVFLAQQVKDFMTFADNHPDLAVELAGDIELTISILGNQSTLDQLRNTMRTRVYTRAALGQLGRSVEPRIPMNEEEFKEVAKWKALGDLVRYGPMAATIPSMITDGAEQLQRGNLTGAVVQGIIKLGKAHTVQTITKEIRPELEVASVAVLDAITGKPMRDILIEQRNIALVKLAGDARRALFKPRTLYDGAKVFFRNQYEAFKEASILEKIVRLGVVVAAPPAIAAAGVGVAVAVANPFGAVVAAVVAIAGVVLAVAVPSLFLVIGNRIPPFRNTMNRVRKNQAQALAKKYREQLIKERTEYIAKLRSKGIIVDPTLPELYTKQWSFTNEHTQLCTEAIDHYFEETVKSLNEKVAQFPEENRGAQIKPKDVTEIFVLFGKPTELKEKLTDIVKAETQSLIPPLSEIQVKELVEGEIKLMSYKLQEKWLLSNLDKAFENDFISRILSSNLDPQTYEREARANMVDNLATYRREVGDALNSELRGNLEGKKGEIRTELFKELGVAEEAAA